MTDLSKNTPGEEHDFGFAAHGAGDAVTPVIEVDPTPACGAAWGTRLAYPDHSCNRPPGHEGRHVCDCGSWAARGEMG